RSHSAYRRRTPEKNPKLQTCKSQTNLSSNKRPIVKSWSLRFLWRLDVWRLGFTPSPRSRHLVPRAIRRRLSLVLPYRPVPRNLRAKIAQARPERALIEVHLGDDHRAELLRGRQRLARTIIDCRAHPVARYILVGAAHEVDVILAGARAGEE